MKAVDHSSVEIERVDAVARLWLNDPPSLNAIDLPMVEALDHALDEVAPWARCIILSGRGRAFSSGGKLTGGGVADPDRAPDVGATLDSHINPLMSRLRALPVPWISAVRGAAAGVGCAFALAADLVVASDKGFFIQAFSRIGLVPDGGSSFLITRAIGRVRAMEMMLLGERIPADQALAWGLVNRVVPDDELEAATLELAAAIAAGPTRALAMIRGLVWSATEGDWETSLANERRLQREAGQTRDFQEGVQAFLEKRPARFTGA